MKSTRKRETKKTAGSGIFNKLIEDKVKTFAIVVISILGLITYSNTFQGEMQFDDTLQIVAKTRINDISNFTSLSHWFEINKRPFAYFTFALNYHWGNYDVEGYHIFNFIIHLLSSIFVFFLARLTFSFLPKTHGLSEKKTGHIAALFAALLFVCHPVQTQAVSYIVQRMTSMSSMFYILGVIFYAYGRKNHISGDNKKAYLMYMITLVSGVFSLLSKQIAVTLPFALLLYEFFFIRDKNGKIYSRYLIFSLVPLLAGALAVVLSGFLPKEAEDISRQDYLITQSRVIVKYFQLLVLPINQNVDYSFSISQSIFGWKEILSALFILGMLGLAIVFHKRKPLIAFGIIWIFLTLAVESSIIPIQDVIFEHRLYLPMFGFVIILSSEAFLLLGKKNKSIPVAVLTLLVIILSISAHNRNEVWQTQFSLWQDTHKKSPDKTRPAFNLSKLYLDEKNLIEARNYADKVIKLDPNYGDAYYILGVCNEQSGNKKNAIRYYKKAIEVDEENGRSMNNLGSLYINEGQYQDAIEYLLMAFKNDRKQISILQNIAIAYYNLKDYKKAIKFNKKLINQDPDNHIILSDIGLSYMQLKNYDEAIKSFKESIAVNPRYINAHINLGFSYLNIGEYEKALNVGAELLKIDPDNTNAKQIQMSARRQMQNPELKR